MTAVLRSYPAFDLVAPTRLVNIADGDGSRNIPAVRHGDTFAVMHQSRNHGELPHFYKFGSTCGYALQCDEDPVEAHARAVRLGHDVYWVNPLPVSVTREARAKETRILLTIGSQVWFEGKVFTLAEAPNGNIRLVPGA